MYNSMLWPWGCFGADCSRAWWRVSLWCFIQIHRFRHLRVPFPGISLLKCLLLWVYTYCDMWCLEPSGLRSPYVHTTQRSETESVCYCLMIHLAVNWTLLFIDYRLYHDYLMPQWCALEPGVLVARLIFSNNISNVWIIYLLGFSQLLLIWLAHEMV